MPVLPFGVQKVGRGFLNYAAINENSRRLNPPARRTSVAWPDQEPAPTLQQRAGGTAQFKRQQIKPILTPSAFSQFSGNIYTIDLTWNHSMRQHDSRMRVIVSHIQHDEQLLPVPAVVRPILRLIHVADFLHLKRAAAGA